MDKIYLAYYISRRGHHKEILYVGTDKNAAISRVESFCGSNMYAQEFLGCVETWTAGRRILLERVV